MLLGAEQVVSQLLELGFPSDLENTHGWTPLNEAIALHNRQIVKIIYSFQKRHIIQVGGRGGAERRLAFGVISSVEAAGCIYLYFNPLLVVYVLLQVAQKSRKALQESFLRCPNFRMELSWKFTSVLLGPLLRRYAPSDVYTIWKHGEKIRIDGTLRAADGVLDEEQQRDEEAAEVRGGDLALYSACVAVLFSRLRHKWKGRLEF